jgi:hypothetical protein
VTGVTGKTRGVRGVRGVPGEEGDPQNLSPDSAREQTIGVLGALSGGGDDGSGESRGLQWRTRGTDNLLSSLRAEPEEPERSNDGKLLIPSMDDEETSLGRCHCSSWREGRRLSTDLEDEGGGERRRLSTDLEDEGGGERRAPLLALTGVTDSTRGVADPDPTE